MHCLPSELSLRHPGIYAAHTLEPRHPRTWQSTLHALDNDIDQGPRWEWLFSQEKSITICVVALNGKL